MHPYVKKYMYVYVNYIIKIQLKPERNRCTPGDLTYYYATSQSPKLHIINVVS